MKQDGPGTGASSKDEKHLEDTESVIVDSDEEEFISAELFGT